ncbi:ATP-grasp domain-containing protein [Paraburkholderia aspalathi]|uniref:ATP-grasp domain-containing protein n=1 Tax=Paraburkholderia aspalathi TaxID=1324617 RepID=UPI003CAD9DCB
MEKKTLFFVALRFAEHFSAGFLETIKRQRDLRMVVLVDDSLKDKIPDAVRSCLDEVYVVNAKKRLTFWPVFSDEELMHAVDVEKTAYPERNIALICCDELNVDVAGRVRRRAGLRGPYSDELARFRDKRIMKEILREHNLRVPKFLSFDADEYLKANVSYRDIVGALGSPFVIKPVDAAGSIGFKIIATEHDLSAYCLERTFESELEVEEFIDGDLFHVDTLVRDGQAIFHAVNEYAYPIDTYARGQMMGSMNVPASEAVYRPMVELATSALRALGATNLSSHMEIFWSNNEAIFLEVAARPPGGLICRSHEMARGVNYVDYDLLIQAGIDFPVPTDRGGNVFWAYFPRKTGIVEELATPDLESAFEIEWRVSKGEVSTYSPHVFDASAAVVASNSNFSVLKKDFEFLKKTELVIVA